MITYVGRIGMTWTLKIITINRFNQHFMRKMTNRTFLVAEGKKETLHVFTVGDKKFCLHQALHEEDQDKSIVNHIYTVPYEFECNFQSLYIFLEAAQPTPYLSIVGKDEKSIIAIGRGFEDYDAYKTFCEEMQIEPSSEEAYKFFDTLDGTNMKILFAMMIADLPDEMIEPFEPVKKDVPDSPDTPVSFEVLLQAYNHKPDSLLLTNISLYIASSEKGDVTYELLQNAHPDILKAAFQWVAPPRLTPEQIVEICRTRKSEAIIKYALTSNRLDQTQTNIVYALLSS